MTIYNTKTATEECNRIYALDTSKVPESVSSRTEKVSVQCLLHKGDYEVSFRKLEQRNEPHSPGCPSCSKQYKEHQEDLKREKQAGHLDGTYESQFEDNFRLAVKVHRAYPGYYDHPHGGDEYTWDDKNQAFIRV